MSGIVFQCLIQAKTFLSAQSIVVKGRIRESLEILYGNRFTEYQTENLIDEPPGTICF